MLVAPSYTAEALERNAKKANVRVLKLALAMVPQRSWDSKRVGGGMLIQTPDVDNLAAGELKVVTKKAPTAAQLTDLLFAWRVARFVKSNAIVSFAAAVSFVITSPGR